ncbi:MAG: UPF0047 protein YjbQ, partial [uncultured Microvirga sp.]
DGRTYRVHRRRPGLAAGARTPHRDDPGAGLHRTHGGDPGVGRRDRDPEWPAHGLLPAHLRVADHSGERRSGRTRRPHDGARPPGAPKRALCAWQRGPRRHAGAYPHHADRGVPDRSGDPGPPRARRMARPLSGRAPRPGPPARGHPAPCRRL